MQAKSVNKNERSDEGEEGLGPSCYWKLAMQPDA